MPVAGATAAAAAATTASDGGRGVAWFKKYESGGGGGGGQHERTHDPTQAKPFVVLTWLRINIERMVKLQAVELTQLTVISQHISSLTDAAAGVHKIDRMVLPLPYCQLLKIFEIFFVFTLPFVLAHQIGHWTPVVACFTAVGFFGLDQVGVELEGPFGVDENDFALLDMGLGMCNDLDAMVRTVKRSRVEARVKSLSREERESIRKGAAAALGWAK